MIRAQKSPLEPECSWEPICDWRFLSLFAALLAPLAIAQPPVTVEDAWIRAAPPGTEVMAGYLTLVNGTGNTAVLVSVSSPQFRVVELHRTTMDGEVARMVALDRVEVAARGRVALEPGGTHLMLIDPEYELQEGDRADLVLRFADGWTLEVNMPIRRSRGHPGHH